MILVIDNSDSFTYNLVQYLGELGEDLAVHRNDTLSLDEIVAMQPARILISPGPGRPEDAGVSLGVITALGATTPIAWWPRQTPRTGVAGPNCLITSTEIPASSGRPGPGEIRMCAGRIASISPVVI